MRIRRHEFVVRRQIIRYEGACEGKQERRYFDHLRHLIRGSADREFDVEFAFVDSKGGSPLVVAKRAHGAGSGRNPLVAVFDFDGKDDEFSAALDHCKLHRIEAGYSNYCFDLWLLLHKRDYSRMVSTSKDYAEDMRVAFDLPVGADLKNDAILTAMMSSIDLRDVRCAIERAESLAANNSGTRPLKVSRRGQIYYHNPDLGIHRFVKKVLDSVSGRIKR